MSVQLERAKMARIYWSRQHIGSTRPSTQAPAATKPNSFVSFEAKVAAARENASRIEEDVGKITVQLGESVSKSDAREWMDRAVSVITERADSIHNEDEKERFLGLASTIKAASPVPDASDEDVMRGLGLLRQRISVQEGDSDHLASLKRHLLSEVEKMLS